LEECHKGVRGDHRKGLCWEVKGRGSGEEQKYTRRRRRESKRGAFLTEMHRVFERERLDVKEKNQPRKRQ